MNSTLENTEDWRLGEFVGEMGRDGILVYLLH